MKKNNQNNSVMSHNDSSYGSVLIGTAVITMIASFIIASVISSKGDAVIAYLVRAILVASLIISLIYMFSGIAAHSA